MTGCEHLKYELYTADKSRDGYYNAWVYGLKDPRTNEIKYIGQARHLEQRIDQHAWMKYGSPLVRKWKAELVEEGLKHKFVILVEIRSKSYDELNEALDASEAALIRKFAMTGSLLNVTHAKGVTR